MITTNSPSSGWSNILFNTAIAAAIADRLVENSEIFLLGGPSVRCQKKLDAVHEGHAVAMRIWHAGAPCSHGPVPLV